MRLILSALLILITQEICHAQVADTLRNKTHYHYLADIDIKAIGRLILNDSFAPTDNYVTFRCMDSLMSRHKETRDYFFLVFEKIVDTADGALAEVVGSHALSYAKKYPKELATRYKCCASEQPCCEKLKKFSSYIGSEIMMADDDKKAYNEFISELSKNFEGWKDDKVLKILGDQVDEVRRTW